MLTGIIEQEEGNMMTYMRWFLIGLMAFAVLAFIGCNGEDEQPGTDAGISEAGPDVGDDVPAPDAVVPDTPVEAGDVPLDVPSDQADAQGDGGNECPPPKVRVGGDCVCPETGIVCTPDCEDPEAEHCIRGVFNPDTCECEPLEEGDYTLHEWGVIVMPPEGGAEARGIPRPFTGPVPAKPVIYIYSEADLLLDVGIHFASGTSTELWPPVPTGPDVAWDGVQVSNGACPTTPLPERNPEEMVGSELSELGEYVVDAASCLTHGETVSKLLFYTGRLPDYTSPLEVDYQIAWGVGHAVFTLHNTSQMPITDVHLVYRVVDSECIDPSGCWARHAILAHGVVDLVPPGQEVVEQLDLMTANSVAEEMGAELDLPPSWAGQPDGLKEKLADFGLTGAEAEAFMKGWTHVFFGVHPSSIQFSLPDYEDGAAAIFLLPEEMYDEQLALTANPTPAEQVRAGVVYQKLPLTCLPTQVEQDGSCVCPPTGIDCNPYHCEPGDEHCQLGYFNDLTCECEPIVMDCERLIAEFRGELAAVRSCEEAAECGRVLQGTSCGCTRNLVARVDADTVRLYELMEMAGELGCDLGLGSDCDCPEADGFLCSDGVCAWNYVR